MGLGGYSVNGGGGRGGGMGGGRGGIGLILSFIIPRITPTRETLRK